MVMGESEKPSWLKGPDAWEAEQEQGSPAPVSPAARDVERPATVPHRAAPTQSPSAAWGYVAAGVIIMLAGALFLAVDDMEWLGFMVLASGTIVAQVGVIAAGVRIGIQSAGR